MARIVRPGAPEFTCTCRRCSARVSSLRAWANLDGPAFTYVCDGCVEWERQDAARAGARY